MLCCKLHSTGKYNKWPCNIDGYLPTERRAIFLKSKNPCAECGKPKSPDAIHCVLCTPRDQRKGIALPDWWKKKIGDGQRGSKGNNWKGGVTPINKRLRHSARFANWRKAVFERDDYICQSCKVRGGNLHPDHIKPFAYFPKLRFELSNGRTLCEKCHRKTPTWGTGATRLYADGTPR